ncbi:organic solvent tolerance protein [Candidatus Pelagibacter sp.]|jgi:LPS-assembly protein|nr:organic solvent tolerance protein [Candidatus Pelagibacter sp.]
MKNNFLIGCFLLLLNIFFTSSSFSYEQFNFDVTEVEITNDGNRFIGKKRGTARTNEGLIIDADEFDYDKILNILNIKGNIKFNDNIKKIKIFSDNATYLKNKEKIFTEGNSKAIDKNGVVMTAHKFEYDKFLNIIIASGNVKVIDPQKDYVVFAEKIKYFRNQEKIQTEGKTKAVIESKYKFNSTNVLFLRNEMELSSSNYSTVEDNNLTFYELEKFRYYLNDKVLKGEDVNVISNYSKEKSDTFKFKTIITKFDDKKFKASETKIIFHNNIFDNERKKFIDLENAKLNELFEDYYDENNPRLYGVSSSGNQNKTVINRGIFTSCKKNNGCPAWSMKSEKIIHDKIKKQVIYKDAVLNVYDFPVFYFPKFFHPDPTVKRQSGILKPELNDSQILGASFNLPYFHVISDNKDLTINPTIFDTKIYMLQNEYRQKNKSSYLMADFGLAKGYKSSFKGSNKNTLSHLFAKFTSDLKLDKYIKSDLNIFLEKTSNDTYLRIFDANIKESDIKPANFSTLKSGFKLDLDHEDYNLTTGMTAYENLSGPNNDRFQFIFPYYNFSKNIETNFDGNLSFTSSGSNTLKDTNNLRSTLSNDLSYGSKDFFSNFGFKNNFGFNLKNFNAVAKNDSLYKTNPQSELMSIFEIRSALPLIKKENDEIFNTLTPKLSLRFNPTNMKNYASSGRSINADNIFSINRLGISDSYESGRSLTIGVDYKKENLEDLEKYFEFKLSTVLRDKFEKNIPISSTINRKNSNIFGSVTNNFSEFIKVDYDFAIDNDLNTIEYNSINTEFSVNNFVTEFSFIEKNGELGSQNTIENTSSIKFDNNNYFTFNTRRNRKTSLTEYYDLVYEYKNDCLTAGIKYKKTYYSDRDIKPSEDLLFTVTLFPLTTVEQKVDQNLYRD